jgi:hypothetical protein
VAVHVSVCASCTAHDGSDVITNSTFLLMKYTSMRVLKKKIVSLGDSHSA